MFKILLLKQKVRTVSFTDVHLPAELYLLLSDRNPLPVNRFELNKFEKKSLNVHDPEFSNIRLWILYV